MEKMISVERAVTLINEAVMPLDPVTMDLASARGRVLAADVVAPQSIPAYPQSGMDGYAFAFRDGAQTYRLDGEIAAGSDRALSLPPGMAIRIFTGAAVPPGADTVLVQERSSVQEGTLQVLDPNLRKGDNVRPVGSEIMQGAKALERGHRLHPASIGFLAGMGIASVSVFPGPRVSVLVTGNELQEPGLPLGYGQVYDANSRALRACLEQLPVSGVDVFRCGDDPRQLARTLEQALDRSDLVLMTGGVSVGDYDFTLNAFEAAGVERIFHKIRQKPGKPILFGMKGRKAVFGLPGNPASVLTCFYEYVLPAIGILMQQQTTLEKRMLPLSQDHTKPAGLTHFLKAGTDGEKVWLQGGQESYKLSSFATANCLVVLPEAVTQVSAGERVEVHLFP
jgi:molybdopterin molybdotransferase